jgi:hypothetical protein
LLGHNGEWTLLDWENASRSAPPFFDLFHYLVQSNHELWFPQRRSIVNGLEGRGWIGRAIRAYAEGAGIAADPARQFFLQYLEDTRASLDPVASRRAVRARRDLARRLNENNASDLTS